METVEYDYPTLHLYGQIRRTCFKGVKVHEVEKWFYSRGAGQHGPAVGG